MNRGSRRCRASAERSFATQKFRLRSKSTWVSSPQSASADLLARHDVAGPATSSSRAAARAAAAAARGAVAPQLSRRGVELERAEADPRRGGGMAFGAEQQLARAGQHPGEHRAEEEHGAHAEGVWPARPTAPARRSCAKNTTDIIVLEIRPISACRRLLLHQRLRRNDDAGEREAEREAGQHRHRDPGQRAEQQRADADTGEAAQHQRAAGDRARTARRTTGIPTIIPAPTIALTIPNTPASACSHSRT